ncbi:MAG: HlyD family efflux transporter periplasmic adaptor subunit [Planctomycetales bacterium]|nr:HlyD family efflux transporter periplasmic adaptor subunit [Planctomycetales bacterium]
MSIAGLISKIVLPIAIIAGGIVVFVMLGEGKQESRRDTTPTGPPRVRVAPVDLHQNELNLRVDGIVVPYREIQLAAEVAGRVSAKSPQCEAGEFVMKDTPLIQIDDRDYELEVRRLNSLLQQAQADLTELDQDIANNRELLELSDKELTLQSREFDRLKMLVGRGVVTESEVDRAEQAVLTARNAKVTRENQLNLLAKRRVRLESAQELAESQLEKARLDVERTTIAAPVDGVIVQESVEAGSFVQRGAQLVTIEDTSRVEVRCNLEMEDLYWIWDQPGAVRPRDSLPSASGYQLPPTPVSIEYRLSGNDDIVYRWNGTLNRFDGIGLDEQTRTVPVRVVVDDPRAVSAINSHTGETLPNATGPQALVRGMFVNVVVHTQPSARIVRIPDSALRPGEQVVRVRNNQLTFLDKLRVIRRQAADQDSPLDAYWLVEASDEQLRDGDQVVVGPLAGMQDGMTVSVISSDPRSLPTQNTSASVPVTTP